MYRVPIATAHPDPDAGFERFWLSLIFGSGNSLLENCIFFKSLLNLRT
jgi:hypothetical protein